VSDYLDIRPDFTGRSDSIYEKFTFFGVLNRFYFYKTSTTDGTSVGGVSRYWKKESTRKDRKSLYEKIIFPHIPDRPMEELLKEDFDEIIQTIQTEKSKQGSPYSAPRLQTIKRLLKLVTEEAAKQGICEDVLFGSSYTIPESETKSRRLEKELVRQRKSLSIKEEFLVYQEILNDACQSGQHMGLALMFCVGLRNEEACGLDFGDIKPMQYHPHCSCLWVYKSTTRGSNQLQASGKTRNMARLLPIPQVLLELLEKRRRFLESEVASGTLVLPPNKTIDMLPIVCNNSDYLTRCHSKHLTAAGRKLFKSIHINEDELAYIDTELEQNRLVEDGIDEKDPTAYLLRRNLGTHLYILGLSEAEIQYIMGHDIEDPYESRNDFTNEDKLYQIKQKMDKRPLVNLDVSFTEEKSLLSAEGCESFRNVTCKEVHISAEEAVRLKLHVSALIPQKDIHMHVTYQNATLHSGDLYSLAGPTTPNSRTVNITQQYHSIYQNVLGRIKESSSDSAESDSED